MKIKVFSIIVSLCFCIASVQGQVRSPFLISTEGFIDLDVNYGALNNTFNRAAMEKAYSSSLNAYDGKLKVSNGASYGFDLKVGYFLNEKKTWGITLGLDYMFQSCNLALDSFHMEYSSTDSKKRPYRQLVSAHPITETDKANNISIPIMLHFQNKKAKSSFFTVDAGLLYNVSMAYNYTASSSFNYEAIYKYNTKTNSFVFDNSANINQEGFIPMTIADYYAVNPHGTNLVGYFNNLSQNWGANIGLNQQMTKKTGTAKYQNGGLGFIIEPALCYQITDTWFLRFGLYLTYQHFDNVGGASGTQFISKDATYNGLINSSTSLNALSYGANIGVKFILKDRSNFDLDFVEEK